MVRTMVIALICFACNAQQHRQGLGSTISGNLVGEDGTPIVGGDVTVHLMPPYPKTRVLKTYWNTLSSAGGSFSVDGLREGHYRLCAGVLDGAWLNPCEWDIKSAPVISVPALPSTASVSIVVKKGAIVPIRIDDPGQLLARNEGRTSGAHLLMGITNEARVFRPAPVVARDSTGRSHQIVVPFDYTAKLVVLSSFFQIADSAGTPLPRTAVGIPVIVPSGTKATTITLRITGGN